MEQSLTETTGYLLLILLSFLVIHLVLLLILIKSTFRKFQILGARVVKTFPPTAILKSKNRDFLIRAFLGTTILTECKSSGFFAILKNPLTKNFDVLYDDLSWGENVRGVLDFIDNLPQHPFAKRLGSLILDGDQLKLKLWHTKYDKGNPEEDLPNALKFLEEIAPHFDRLPRSLMGNSKERARQLLCFKIPLVCLIALILVSLCLVVAGFGGKVICYDQKTTVGFKSALPVVLLYLALAFTICGKSLLKYANHLSSLFILLGSKTIFFAYIGVDLINEFLDKSQPKIITTKVYQLRISRSDNSKRYLIAVENIPCFMKVSKELFKKLREGDSIKLIIRNGALGLKWHEKILQAS